MNEPRYPYLLLLAFVLGWTPFALMGLGVLPKELSIGIAAYIAAAPLTGFAIYGVLVGAYCATRKLARGEALWSGGRHLAMWSEDFRRARDAGLPVSECPSSDDYCLRRRIWRRIKGRG